MVDFSFDYKELKDKSCDDNGHMVIMKARQGKKGVNTNQVDTWNNNRKYILKITKKADSKIQQAESF